MWAGIITMHYTRRLAHYWIESQMGPELQIPMCRKPPSKTRNLLVVASGDMRRCGHCLAIMNRSKRAEGKKDE